MLRIHGFSSFLGAHGVSFTWTALRTTDINGQSSKESNVRAWAGTICARKYHVTKFVSLISCAIGNNQYYITDAYLTVFKMQTALRINVYVRILLKTLPYHCQTLLNKYLNCFHTRSPICVILEIGWPRHGGCQSPSERCSWRNAASSDEIRRPDLNDLLG